MKNIFKKFGYLFVLVLLPAFMFAQEPAEKKSTNPFDPYWYLTLHGGLAQEFNDFPDDLGIFSGNNGAGGLNFGRQFSPVFGLRLHGIYADLTADGLIDGNLNATVNLSNLFFKYKERFLSVYIFGGGGLIISPEVTPLGNGGGGLELNLSEKIALNLEYGLHIYDNTAIAASRDFGYANLGFTYKFRGGNELKKMKEDFEEVEFTVEPKVLVEKGQYVEVKVKGKFPEKYFGKKAAMLFQPVLKYEGGETAFKPITLKGEDVLGDGILISNKEGGSFTYSDKIPYTPEMNIAELVIEPVAYVAKEKVYLDKGEIVEKAKYVKLGKRKLADGTIYTSERIYPGDANFLIAHHGYEEEVIISESAKIFFRVNISKINWYYPLNKEQAAINALENLYAFIEKGWKIKNIKIDGYASPEGEESRNEDLSENRALNSEEYLIKKIKKMSSKKDAKIDYTDPENDITFKIDYHGPDWDGFMTMVGESDIKDKNAILNVIRSAKGNTAKEEEIRNMINIYPEIEDEILKPLRRACISVNCFEPKRTKENIAELSTTYPDSLLVEELLFSATLTDDGKTRLTIYESVMEIYPDAWQAYNNAAVCNMKHGNYNEALALLEKAKDRAPNSEVVFNNMGILSMYMNDYSSAKANFEKAQSLGANTDYNDALIAIYEGNYDNAISLMSGKSCDYNLGLAQLVSDDYSKAEKTLKCAKNNKAEANYLLAIIGAKTDNSSMLYDHLTKAIKADPELKAQAANDREFMNYMNDPDFKALVD